MTSAVGRAIGVALAVALTTTPAYADFTSAFSGSTATMTGDTQSDTIVIDSSGGLLRHNRFTAGDAGFNSDFDFDTGLAGDQTIASAFPTSHVNVNAGNGDDVLAVGSAATPASNTKGLFTLDGQGGSDLVDLDDSVDFTGRFLTVDSGNIFIPSNSSLFFSNTENARAETGTGNDSISVRSSTAGAQTTVSAGAGVDILTIAGSLSDPHTLAGPVVIHGNADTDVLTFDDDNFTAAHSYAIGSSTIQRDADGLISFDGIEAGALNAGSAADSITKSGLLAFTLNGNGGNDTFTTHDAVGDAVNCGDGADTVALSDPLDVLATDCETNDRSVTAPALTATDPASPANQNLPRVKGSAPTGATVRVYTTADCSGTPGATGTAADLGSAGIAVLVADNTTTAFHATATNAGGYTSPCSDALTYVEDSTVPAPDTTPPALTLSKLKSKISIRTLLKGITVKVTPNEASALSVVMLGSAKRATAAALKYNLTLASASHKLAAGQQKFKLKVRKRLIGTAKVVHVRLRVTATDAAGNHKTVTRSFTARRR